MTEPRIDRRTFLAGVAATGVVAVACAPDGDGDDRGGAETTADDEAVVPEFEGDPFTLGVASGDPTDTSVILWTRLAPRPTAPGGGMAADPVPVRWQLATDGSFAGIVGEGQVTTGPDVAHSVHVEAEGLEPDTAHWYRFSVGDRTSEVGRTRTLAAPGRVPPSFALAQVSCQRWDQGHYAAFRDIADAGVDLVVHCGDYIYERPAEDGETVRPAMAEPAVTLEDYRAAYGLYKGDAHLRAAHAAAPWVITWDDHEVSNNYVGDTPGDNSESETVAQLRDRRAAGYRAWWEHMPVRLDPPEGPDLAIFRKVVIGDLARIHVLDTRQYRTRLDCESESSVGRRCEASFDPETTVLGAEQEAWLEDGLAEPGPTWDVVAQQIALHQWRFGEGDDVVWNLDQWDGYPAARERLLAALGAAAGQPVVLTGDVHSSWVADLVEDFDEPGSPRVGTEFVVPGISSTPSTLLEAAAPQIRRFGEHVRYDQQTSTGWLRHDVDPDGWTAAYRFVVDPTDPDGALVDGAGFVLTPDGELTQTRP